METGHCVFLEIVSIFPPLVLVREKKQCYRQKKLFFAKLLHAKPKHASGKAVRNEGVSPRRHFSYGLIPLVIITSWFAIALDEIRTRRILREKADCKKSIIKHT